MYIRKEAINGNHGNPISTPFEGAVVLPDELVRDYIDTMGFADLELDENETVVSVTLNTEAYEAYIAGLPAETEAPEPEPGAEELINILLGVSE